MWVCVCVSVCVRECVSAVMNGHSGSEYRPWQSRTDEMIQKPRHCPGSHHFSRRPRANIIGGSRWWSEALCACRKLSRRKGMKASIVRWNFFSFKRLWKTMVNCSGLFFFHELLFPLYFNIAFHSNCCVTVTLQAINVQRCCPVWYCKWEVESKVAFLISMHVINFYKIPTAKA